MEAEAKERQQDHGGTAPGRAATLPQIIGGVSEDAHAGEATAGAATLVGTNRQYVSDAKKLHAEAPALFDGVKAGRLTIPEAKKAAVAVDLLPWLEAEAQERQREHGSTAPGRAATLPEIIAGVSGDAPAGEARDQAATLVGTNRQYVSDAKALQTNARRRARPGV